MIINVICLKMGRFKSGPTKFYSTHCSQEKCDYCMIFSKVVYKIEKNSSFIGFIDKVINS